MEEKYRDGFREGGKSRNCRRNLLFSTRTSTVLFTFKPLVTKDHKVEERAEARTEPQTCGGTCGAVGDTCSQLEAADPW